LYEPVVRPGAVATATAVHHVGMSVANLDEALSFWESFLGVKARWRAVLNRPYLGEHVGIPGVSIRAAFIDLPGGVVLELLDYETPDRKPIRRRPRIRETCISAWRSTTSTLPGSAP
jgi:hypothetical protein